MRFLIDAQLPPGLARHLTDIGHDAVHVVDKLKGDATDAEVADYAAGIRAVIISKDEDFVDLAKRGLIKHGVVWVRIGNVTNRVLWEKIYPLLPTIVSAIEAGEPLVEIN